MTIHPNAVKEFIDQTRDNWDWMKKIPDADLDRELERLGIKLAHPKPLLIHQKVCFLLGVAWRAFAFWLDLGTGKTRLALELMRYHMARGDLTGALVLVKSQSAIISWENQIAEWNIDIPYISLEKDTSSEFKWQQLEDFQGGLILVTAGGLTRMMTELAAKKGKRKRKLVWSEKAIKRMSKLIQAIIADEAKMLANRESEISRVIHQLRKHVSFYYELTGVPLGRDPIALWHQLFLVDRGETLGETLGMFRAAFFDEKDNYFGGKDYTFRKSEEPRLYNILKHRTISYDESECQDLPKHIQKPEVVRLPDEASRYYQTFVKQIRARYAGFQERKNAFIRMRQVSSGFVGFVDDETGERAEIEFKDNPKLDRLLELVDQVPKGRKFVIFHEFIHTGKMITAALKDAGLKHDWLWGGSKDERGIQDRYDNDDKTRGILASIKVAAYSLNLQRGNYYFVFEAPVPADDDRQMRKRLHRGSQTRTVFGYNLLMEGTVDFSIQRFHKEGRDLYKALVNDPEAVLQ